MFYSQVFLGMEYAARKSDYYILLTTVKENFDPKTDLPRFLKYNDIDGVALAGRVPYSLVDYLDKQRMPFVLIDYGIAGKIYNSVLIDNYNGAYHAVKSLIQSGRERIGFVGGTFFLVALAAAIDSLIWAVLRGRNNPLARGFAAGAIFLTVAVFLLFGGCFGMFWLQ